MKNTTTNKNSITAIYVRRSVSDKDNGNNSLSITAQREECIRFVGDCEYQVYCDDGKSGKDVQHRPAFMQMMQDAGVKTIICTDISRDGAMRGTNRELYRQLSEKLDIDIVASGGVSAIEDVEALAALGIHGAIIGKAYYTGAIDLAEAVEKGAAK